MDQTDNGTQFESASQSEKSMYGELQSRIDIGKVQWSVFRSNKPGEVFVVGHYPVANHPDNRVGYEAVIDALEEQDSGVNIRVGGRADWSQLVRARLSVFKDKQRVAPSGISIIRLQPPPDYRIEDYIEGVKEALKRVQVKMSEPAVESDEDLVNSILRRGDKPRAEDPVPCL